MEYLYEKEALLSLINAGEEGFIRKLEGLMYPAVPASPSERVTGSGDVFKNEKPTFID